MKKLLLILFYFLSLNVSAQNFFNLPPAGAVTISDSCIIHRPGSYYKSALAQWPFATTTSLSGYLPLSGGTMTGPIDATNLILNGSTAIMLNSSLLPVGEDKRVQLGGAITLAGDITQNQAPTFIEFVKGDAIGDPYPVRASVGFLGTTEVNTSINMDYATGSHKYYDPTKPASWTYLSTCESNEDVFGLQYVPANNPNSDIFNTYGCRPFYVELVNQPATGKGINGFSRTTTGILNLVDATNTSVVTNSPAQIRLDGGIMKFEGATDSYRFLGSTPWVMETYSTGTSSSNDLNLGVSGDRPTGNIANINFTIGTNSGLNIGGFDESFGGLLNIGRLGKAVTAKNSGTNIGVMGVGLNAGTSPTHIGGYFSLYGSDNPSYTSAALIADNGTQSDPIFLARDNGSNVFSINNGGTVNIGSTTASTVLYSDASKNLTSLANGTGVLTNDGIGGLSWGSGGGSTFADNVFRVQDNGDATKQIAFEASGITTGTTRTFTVPNSSGTLALTSDKLSDFAATTSSELAGNISDETGSGALVFATSPTFTTPILGVPTSGTLTNCTGLPMTSGVTGILPGTNGGTGVNNSTRTLTYAGNVAFTGAFNPTFSIPQSTTWTFPNTASETLAGLGTAQTFTQKQTFTAATTEVTALTLLDATYKTALDINSSTSLRLGFGFSTLHVAANTITGNGVKTFTFTSGMTITGATSAVGLSISHTFSGSTTGDIFHQRINGSFTKANQNANYFGMNVVSTINQTGTSVGDITFMNIDPTITAFVNTNNLYGIRSNIASGTNKWNIYVSGTADNAFAGRSFFGGTTAPTANIHLAASTTAASTASLKLGEGSRQTSAEDGTINYVANNLEFVETSTVYTLAKTLTNTATLDFGSTGAGVSTDLTITVTGAADGDAVSVGVPNASTVSAGDFTAWVSATNTVTVRFSNNSAGALDPASGTFRVSVIKY